MVVSPWFGLGVGLGAVNARGTNEFQSAGPSFAGLLDAGGEIAGRIFVAAERYGQSGLIIEDESNGS